MKTILTIFTLVFLSFIATLIYVNENKINCEDLINEKLLNRDFNNINSKLYDSRNNYKEKCQEKNGKVEVDLDRLMDLLFEKLEKVKFESKLPLENNYDNDKNNKIPSICQCGFDKSDYLPPEYDNNCIDHNADENPFESYKESSANSWDKDYIPNFGTDN
ncbi:uncharacterized protein LOC130665665 isoform X2 [Microplitis mediator]|uniref:uncharacterized protein LOC130665665 isoform X2 n=1 Tax=Microplitis mediator TaxID=375433 RepID=UPI002557ADC3|nr:uncharacterized protein LOC130665665 isoform X2 [Microplitis mediator]